MKLILYAFTKNADIIEKNYSICYSRVVFRILSDVVKYKQLALVFN